MPSVYYQMNIKKRSQFNIIGDGSNLINLKNISNDNSNIIFHGKQIRGDMVKFYKASDFLIVSLIDKSIFSVIVPAKTKGLGEIVNNKHLTLRTSVVGPELKTDGEELFHWFMNQQSDISGFTKTIWSGVTTLELAKAIKWSIDSDISGLYHVTNNSSISKYELLKLFQKYTKKDIDIKSVNGKNIDKSFIDTRKELNYAIPSYEEMVKNMIDLMKNNKLYKQYKVSS